MHYELNEKEWRVIKPMLRISRGTSRVSMTGAFSTASFGSCDQARNGHQFRQTLDPQINFRNFEARDLEIEVEAFGMPRVIAHRHSLIRLLST